MRGLLPGARGRRRSRVGNIGVRVILRQSCRGVHTVWYSVMFHCGLRFPKLKSSATEILGKSDPWDELEKRGNAADSALVRRYLSYAQTEQRRSGFTVKQARPMLAPLLLRLVRHMRKTARQLQTMGDRVARSRDVPAFVVAFHTMQRGFDFSMGTRRASVAPSRRSRDDSQYSFWQDAP